MNHSKNFKGPITGAHTNMEEYWKHTRDFMPGLQKDDSDKEYADYLLEFSFRKRYRSDIAKKLMQIIIVSNQNLIQ